MRIALGFDHAGVPLREVLIDGLRAAGHEPLDAGTTDDYPDIALSVGRLIHEGTLARGVLVCGSGAGVAVAAAKLPGIRAATVHDTYTAHQCVEHDDLNVLCLGARVIGPQLALEIALTFAAASFSGEERHIRRVGKVAALEDEGFAAPIERDLA
jgi:ribose 5-phosphate isomerase B